MADELWHYGILGMRWGVRRFQNKNGELTAAGRKRYGEGGSGSSKSKSSSNSTKSSGSESEIEKKSKGIRLTDKQKTALKVGGVIVGVGLLAFGAYKLNEAGAFDNAKKIVDDMFNPDSAVNQARQERKAILDNSGKLSKRQKEDFATREVDSKLSFLKKRNSGSAADDLAAVNEGMWYEKSSKFKKGASNNCSFCTTAYELRRRGYDVKANYTEQGRSLNRVKDFFKNAVVNDDSDFALNSNPFATANSNPTYLKKVKQSLEKFPEGARGNFCLSYSALYGGGGHSIIWEIENGKAVFKDGQTGKVYKDISDAIGLSRPGANSWFRTDNLEINPDTIKDAVTNVGVPRSVRNVMENDPTLANAYRQEVVKLAKTCGMSLQEAREQVRKIYGVKV